MGEFSSQVDQKNKTATPAPVPEEISDTGELEYVDARASTAQLISLQAAADGRNNRSTSAQLQAKALSHAGNSRIAQLQALSDSRPTTAKNNPIQRQENKTGLPDQLKTGMESISGLSLSDVKVHRNSDKPAQLQAHAYAQGTDIHLGPGQEKHLPHELGHVVQQKQGRVKPTMQLKGKVNINDNAGLEKEADVLGAKALQMKAMPGFQTAQTISTSTFSSNTFQLALKGAKNQEEIDDDLAFANTFPEKGNEEFSFSNRALNPAPDKIDRRKDDQWAIGPKNKDGKGVEETSSIVDENKLDDDLWFKSSEGIEGMEATDKHLPTYTQGISSAFHVTTNERSAQSILNRVDPRFHNPLGRFGGGFYVASDLNTAYAEVHAHEYDNFDKGEYEKGLLSAVHLIEYTGAGSADLVDASSTDILADMVKNEPKKIEKKVRQDARDGIVFNSTKGAGKNIVFFKNYGVLKVKGDGYTGAAEGFRKFKIENGAQEAEL
uniref:eCIS core domain-containing protein n=1 Tax=Algoriphagus sp. TaxID=1872435 RepID=UPI004048913F